MHDAPPGVDNTPRPVDSNLPPPPADPPPTERSDITGLVLAGGRGQRMGGVDKSLLQLDGRPLVQHALERLRPQVGPLALNANRMLDTHATWGVPVWPDLVADQPGPLAGWHAGLSRCTTPWLVTVPCDTPRYPADLVARLADAARRAGAELAMATAPSDGRRRAQPVFCLLHRSLLPSLAEALMQGLRKVDRYAESRRVVFVDFEDEAAFFNVNTPEDLARAEGDRLKPPAPAPRRT